MASASQKTTPCAHHGASAPPPPKLLSAVESVIRPVDSIPDTAKKPANKGISVTPRSETKHPLDPLSAAEISVAVATVRAAGANPEVRDSMRFIEVASVEPEKHVVALADAYFFPPFQPSLLPRTKAGPVIPMKLPPRRARLVVYNKTSNETSVWIVELSSVHAVTRGGHHRGRVVSSQVIPDVQPPMDAEEYAECEAIVKDFPPFIEAMKRRGIDDMDLVMVDPWCVGYHSEADAPSRRLAKPLIYCRTDSDCPMENGYARPVEGIYVLVDMQNMVVIEFEDRKFVPLPPPDPLRNYTPGESRGGVDRSDVKPLEIIQPEGPSFRVRGYFVEWQKWNFRIGFTPREGLVIHSVAYVDGSRGRRPVAHRLSFVEMVVPYGDPNEPHYRKNAFDAGEDGLGKNAHSLKKGCDCLGSIKYFDAHFTNFTGGVETIENCVCLHEEDHGILWKHQDWRTGLAEVRRSRRLTVSFFCTVANYEYGFYWHFYQDGKIEAEVKLTGILSLGALQPGETRKYGTTIAPGLYAPVHQHFFIARMDMSVDCKPGEAYNQVVEVNVKVDEPGENNIHNNAFYAEEKLLRSEAEATRDCDPFSARHWIVRNTRTVNRTGQLTGYKLVPGSNCLPLARPEAKFLRRAAFLKHNLWVTRYAPDEKFPGGEFPNQNPRAGEGLATWVKQNRSLEESDVVLWYVFGITHVPRLEDWPVMPVEHIGFTLMPHGFFNCSPAVDVPPNPACELDTKDSEVKEVVSVSNMFVKHPDVAVDIRSDIREVKTAYMNILLGLVQTLDKPPQSLSETELSNADSELSELTDAGFKLDWLKSKLEEVSLKRKEPSSHLKVELDKEKIESTAAPAPRVSPYLLVHPKETRFDDHLSVYLCVYNPKSLRTGWQRKANFRFTLLNSNQSGNVLNSATERSCLFCAQFSSWGHKTLPLSKLKEEEFLENSKLFIKVDVKVVDIVHEAEITGKETLFLKGFDVLYSQCCEPEAHGFDSVHKIFEKHPNIAIDFKPKDKGVKAAYMNLLLSLIETLRKPLRSFSETELSDAASQLNELTEAGFKLDWLKTRFEEIYLERKNADADKSRAQEVEERIKNLELTLSDLKVELEKEKAKSAADATFLSFDEIVLGQK
ncbi:hypothetical protein HID58_052329 [Brassica napus]|uniref:Amine oxidase n=1 Tax=Brassica napus TaxID=3708 RepID=A0ABQ8ACY4_BRANA|nr:hypothetical protein HID58_052329 [Brassica napus]